MGAAASVVYAFGHMRSENHARDACDGRQAGLKRPHNRVANTTKQDCELPWSI
jgi:hypothetical protein